MFSKSYIKKLGKGFHPSWTRYQNGENRQTRRRKNSSYGKYKEGALVIVGTTKFRYTCQRILDYAGNVVKKIYGLREVPSQKFV